MKIALIHDYLFEYGGSERVVEHILRVFPQADLFCLFDFLPEKDRGFLGGRLVQTTFLQNIPLLRRNPARFLPYIVPLMPFAIEQLDLSAYDLVLSSSHSAAKGVLTGPDEFHLAYIHSPMRYAWDQQGDYRASPAFRGPLKGTIGRALLTWLRLWDARTANGVDQFAANSAFIARRIRKVYRREAAVIYPPVEIDRFPFVASKGDYYLTVSRMVPYKRVDLIIEAFRRLPDRQLVVIGSGPDERHVRAMAGSNVRFLGNQSQPDLAAWMGGARALIHAAQEDFGITLVEAQAAGTPVIAYGRGGAREIVRGPDSPSPTGIFFHQQSAEAVEQAVRNFESEGGMFDPSACRENSLRFNPDRFQAEFLNLVESGWADFRASPGAGLPISLLQESIYGRP